MQQSKEWHISNGIRFKQPEREIFLMVSGSGCEWTAEVISERGIRREVFKELRQAKQWAEKYGREVTP